MKTKNLPTIDSGSKVSVREDRRQVGETDQDLFLDLQAILSHLEELTIFSRISFKQASLMKIIFSQITSVQTKSHLKEVHLEPVHLEALEGLEVFRTLVLTIQWEIHLVEARCSDQ